jgi:hypothetical protein
LCLPCRSDDKKKKARRDGFAAAEEREASARGDDRVLEMMRSFSFVQATEEDFLEGMAAYEYNHVDAATAHEQYDRDDAGTAHEQYNHVDAGTAHEHVEPEPFAPAPASSLSFKFQHQTAEIPQEATAVSREQEEKAPSIPSESAGKHGHEDIEAEETELLLEEHVEEQRREVVEQAAPSKVVANTHNYQFLTERDFRGFVREPETMTVRVQEAFTPPLPTPSPPLPQQHEERRVANIVPRTSGFLTERDFLPADEPDARESVASSGKRTPSWSRKPADKPDVCESVASSGKRTPSLSRKTADDPDVCESVASSRKRSPPRSRKPASSPSVASKGSAVDARMSFASEFSGFGDSDSESSGSDGYSVKDLVVDSDSDWFLSEKDFPASARNSGNLKSYKAKVLKAMEALEAATKLEQSYQDSATTVSPGSVCQGSPDTIPDGSPKFPEDMWSRSPSPDVEYKEDEEKVTREAEAQYDEDVEQRRVAEDEGSVDMSDDEHSPEGKKVESAARVYDMAPADNSMDHSEKETITLNDYSGEATSDTQKSPEAVSAKELAAVPLDQVAGPAKRSPEPSEKEFIGLVDHSLDHSSDDRRETSSESGQSYEIVFDDKSRPEPLEAEFANTNDNEHSHELISDVWKEISRNDQTCTVADANERGLDVSEEELVGKNDSTNEFISYEKKVTFSAVNDRSFAVISDEKSIPETTEEQFSVTDHRNGVVLDAKNISETRKDEEEASANDYMDDAARQAYVSVTGKAKIYEEEGEDPEVKWNDLTEEEDDELESLWEHQDLIEQLKLELKKVRSVGLPTILEESETPKAPMEDLKPWRIDAKFLREDPMDELNKFYKSYRERMRKFDILCYQKMYAIGMINFSENYLSLCNLIPLFF